MGSQRTGKLQRHSISFYFTVTDTGSAQKWWSSGAGDKRCKIYIVMAKSDPNNKSKYAQQSVILVPADTPGVTIHRMLSVMGFDDAPHGHGHISSTLR